MQHKISNLNKENSTGDCRICGTVRVFRTDKVLDRWRCANLEKTQRLKKNKAANLRNKLRNPGSVAICEICGKTAEENGKALALDHCHTTGINRGYLCIKCNFGLGYFKDNVIFLSAAIDYLKRKAP